MIKPQPKVKYIFHFFSIIYQIPLRSAIIGADKERAVMTYDDTIDTIETWLNDRVYAHPDGELTVAHVQRAYIESSGMTPDPDEIYSYLSDNFTASTASGELVFRAVLEH